MTSWHMHSDGKGAWEPGPGQHVPAVGRAHTKHLGAKVDIGYQTPL